MPLANILAPQIMKKAQEIADAIGPPSAPRATGYLQAGYEKTPYDPNGVMNKQGPKSYDSSLPGNAYFHQLGEMQQRTGDPGTQAFAAGAAQGLTSGIDAARDAQPLPTSPAAPMKLVSPGTKTPRVIKLPAGAVGQNERGQDVSAKGKNLGYLAKPGLVTPSGDTALRTGDRTGKDISFGDAGPQVDALNNAEMQKAYGAHLKAAEEYTGKGMFPPDYFKGMSADQKAGIIKGVKELQQRAKIAKEGISA